MKVSVVFLCVGVLAAFVAADASAQRKRSVPAAAPNLEELPRMAIDTLPTADPETRVVIYTNNTWSYYRPSLDGKFGALPVYTENWDTAQIFAYRSIELDDLPQVVDLRLIESLSDFHTPIKGTVFSKYGRRGRRNHNGVDIPLKIGEPVYAAFDGRVRYSKYNTGGYGNLVIIRHANGLETWYAHLSKRNNEPGDYVKAGQIIGFGGSTGRSRGPHLHFECRYCDQTFDPEYLINFEEGALKYQTFALEKSFLNINSRASDQLEDHDFDDLASITTADGEEVTSEDIIAHIENAQSQPPKSATPTVAASDAVYHTVRSGDMLGKIAIRYGVSIDQLCRLNNISRTTLLKIGRKLRVK